MSMSFVERELELLMAQAVASGDESAISMQQMMNDNLKQICELVDAQGHSGFSISYLTATLTKLLRQEPITPIADDADDWIDVGDDFYQHRRCGHVFKEKSTGRSYDIDFRIFVGEGGTTFTSGRSREYISFPYTPSRVYAVDHMDAGRFERAGIETCECLSLKEIVEFYPRLNAFEEATGTAPVPPKLESSEPLDAPKLLVECLADAAHGSAPLAH